MFGLYDTLARMRAMLPWQEDNHPSAQEIHRHGGADILRNLVFGANDGLVSNASLVAAVAGATATRDTILLGGLAGLAAGSLSMALGAFVATRSEREFRESEERRERWEIEHMPQQERGEIRQIYRRKGLKDPLLDAVVDQLTKDKDQWLQLMMSEELGFAGDSPRPLQSALIMGLAFVAGAVIPVIPYLFSEGLAALFTSLGLTAAALFMVGAWRAYLTGGVIWRKATEMVVLAAVAIGAANLIGRLVGVGID
jgi:VIT1/CCC1 family predicted Fe2+/Mn2+ transporter